MTMVENMAPQTAERNDAPSEAATAQKPGFVAALMANRNLQSVALIPVIIVVMIAGALISPAFLTPVNLFNNILAFSAALGILVIAESIILIGGYFDLSLQSTVGFSIVLFMFLSTDGSSGKPGLGLPIWLAALIAIAAVIVIGLFNGAVVAVLNLNAFIVTLAMLILLQGLTLGISNGQTYVQVPDFILYLGAGDV